MSKNKENTQLSTQQKFGPKVAAMMQLTGVITIGSGLGHDIYDYLHRDSESEVQVEQGGPEVGQDMGKGNEHYTGGAMLYVAGTAGRIVMSRMNRPEELPQLHVNQHAPRPTDMPGR